MTLPVRRWAAASCAAVACACAGTAPPVGGPPHMELPTRPMLTEDETVAGGMQDAPPTPLADPYRAAAARIVARAMASPTAWERLAHLTDRIGNRLGGSAALERAVAWATETMRADGHENVRAEKVMVPHWVRGRESARLVEPRELDLPVLALGGSAGTPRGGITDEVVAVHTFDELEALGRKGVEGRIVLFDKVMPPYGPEGPKYGETVVFRTKGPAAAAKLGAAAALVRSVTATSLRTPHTGATSFGDTPPIPAAALTIEDTELVLRLLRAGARVRIHLELDAKTLPDAESANVIGEIVGRELPDEVVLLGAHLDSWDVGQGAHDDGGPCVATMEALATLRRLGLRPRRTLRAVLFTNEENGLRGAKAYAEAHGSETHVAAIESDSGAFAPEGFRVQGSDEVRARVADVVTLLRPLGADTALAGFSGADLIPLSKKGVPTLGLHTEGSRYFDYHHSPADTLDKVSPEHLKQDAAAVAVVAYVLADMPGRLDER